MERTREHFKYRVERIIWHLKDSHLRPVYEQTLSRTGLPSVKNSVTTLEVIVVVTVTQYRLSYLTSVCRTQTYGDGKPPRCPNPFNKWESHGVKVVGTLPLLSSLMACFDYTPNSVINVSRIIIPVEWLTSYTYKGRLEFPSTIVSGVKCVLLSSYVSSIEWVPVCRLFFISVQT